MGRLSGGGARGSEREVWQSRAGEQRYRRFYMKYTVCVCVSVRVVVTRVHVRCKKCHAHGLCPL